MINGVLLYLSYALLQSIYFTELNIDVVDYKNRIIMFSTYILLAPALTLGVLFFTIFKLSKWIVWLCR